MDEKLELELVKKYPKILRDFRGDPKLTCMAWGIETQGNGWYNLLDQCMEKLQYFCDICSNNGREVQVIADQIKSKFAALSFYFSVNGANEIEYKIIDDIISEAERKSARTCEITGDHGELCRKGNWLMTICRKEARKLGYIACNAELEKYWQEKDAQELNS